MELVRVGGCGCMIALESRNAKCLIGCGDLMCGNW